MIKRKRKKSFKSFDPLNSNEERKKEQPKKRSKIGNESSKRITEWLILKESKKLDSEKRNENNGDKKEIKDEDSMNVDMELLKINNPFIKKS